MVARKGKGKLEPPEKRQFNVYLPADLVKALKIRAVEDGESLARLVEAIFRDYLKPQTRGRHR